MHFPQVLESRGVAVALDTQAKLALPLDTILASPTMPLNLVGTVLDISGGLDSTAPQHS
jgi:hypothetical protein